LPIVAIDKHFSTHIPTPTSPTLFPYTTLFRSPSDRAPRASESGHSPDRPYPRHSPRTSPGRQSRSSRPRSPCPPRSRRRRPTTEIGRAHSELQSRGQLVCRLLLEKKNKLL